MPSCTANPKSHARATPLADEGAVRVVEVEISGDLLGARLAGEPAVTPHLVFVQELDGHYPSLLPAIVPGPDHPARASVSIGVVRLAPKVRFLLVIAGIVLSLQASVGGGSARLLQLRENLVTGLIGLVFLVSIAAGHPLV